MTKKIETLRAEVSILSEYLKNRSSTRLEKKVKSIMRKHRTPVEGLTAVRGCQEDVKQKLQATAQRLRRYTRRSDQYRQNKMFRDDAKKFYRELGKKNIQIQRPPDSTETKQFWQNILEDEAEYNKDAQWIKDQEKEHDDLQQMKWEDISVEEVKASVTKTSNWKSPGPDKLPNFWIKRFTSLHKPLAKAYSTVLSHPERIPEWLVEGSTNLLPKKAETWIPKNYRPIACLPTTFKVLTSIVTDRLYKHLESQNIMAIEQRGCKRDCYGCKDQLLINNAILENCHVKKKNLSTAWIDYKKAFDSVPHSWLLKCMEIYKVHPTLTQFIASSMAKWKTNMTLVHNGGVLETGPIQIKRGIFQGDSLSPLLFTMALNPISTELIKTGYGYQLDKETKVNHLFYVDDLKLYGTSDTQLTGLVSTVKKISDDIKMEFGLDKCAKATFRRGKKATTENIPLSNEMTIRELDQERTYTYLGIEEADGTEHHKMKAKVKKEYKRRLKLVLRSQLNARNKITAINTLAVPVVSYSYGVLNWKLEEVKDLDRMTRKQLCMNRMHARKADIHRIYLPNQEGGRGLMNLEKEYKATIIGLHKYLANKSDPQIVAVLRHHNAKALYSIPKQSTKYLEEMSTEDTFGDTYTCVATAKAKMLKVKYKADYQKAMGRNWSEKPMHGKFPRYLQSQNIDVEQSFQWMKHTGLKGETEGLIMAAQDQALNTRYYSKHVMKQENTDICRMCHQQPETVDHIMAGCTKIAADMYLERHNKVAAELHLDVCKHYGIQTQAKNWYEHKPERVAENDDVTVLWDSQIHTDRHIPSNKPDIVIREKKTNKCLLIDVAVPSDYNIQKKATEKELKYVDLQIECQRMWAKNVQIVPVIVGATGVVESRLKADLKKIPGRHNIYSLQRSAILGTAHILRKVLSIRPD